MSLNQLLYSYRIKNNITLRDFCKEFKINAAYWSSFERGYAPAPAEDYFYLLIKEKFHLSHEDFLLILKLRKSHYWNEEPPFF